MYVERFPDLGDRRQISTGGGREPVWSPGGDELFYRNDNAMVAVPVQTGQDFVPGTPEVMFEGQYRTARTSRFYDIAPDGRFLLLKATGTTDDTDSSQVHLVQNWFTELQARVPTGR